jgi:outer membrane receptor protein involved in Fe transport
MCFRLRVLSLRFTLAIATTLVLIAGSLPLVPAEAADAAVASLTGSIVSADNGLAIPEATVRMYNGTTKTAETTTDDAGRYAFPAVQPGIYSLEIQAQGRETTRVDNVVLTSGSTTNVTTPLAIARTNADTIREIGRTTSTSNATTLASSAVIQHDLDPVQLEQQGYIKAGDALGALPGVNLSGGPHTVGDDTFLDIRGAGPSESRTLLDGHPIGPGGSIGINGNPQNYVYNFSNSPFDLLDKVQVTVGSGATGLYGVTAIGGTIDFQTLNPTKVMHDELSQRIGSDGIDSTVFKGTGTFGNLGYALGYSVDGTYNDFAPQNIFQSARPNNDLNLPGGGACTASNDISTCNQLLNTYPVSGNYLVKTNLEKLRYDFTPSTALTLTTYFSNQISDSTGNGDNDYVPYSTRLYAINNSGLAGTGGCAAGLYPVITNSGNACDTAQQWATASYGPDGGGLGRTRGVRLYDYSERFTTALGMQNLTVENYNDFYQYHKESCLSNGLDATGTYCVGNNFANNYTTNGILVSDDIVLGPNDLGVGWFDYHQLFNGWTYNTDANYMNPTTTQYGDVSTGQNSFFLREAFTPNSPFSAVANAWLTTSNVTNQTVFDPRLSLVYKVTPNDVVRLTGGRTDGFPNASLKVGGVQSIGATASSLNACPGTNNPYPIAGASNPALTSESANDVEAAYGHRFWSDTSFNVVGYVSSERNQMYQTVAPLSSLSPAILNSALVQGLLGQFTTQLTNTCGVPVSTATAETLLGVSTTINISSALYRGLEFQGRIRGTKNVYLDYSYQAATAQQFGIPNYVLNGNAFAINGAQIYEIPRNKGSMALDYQDLRGLEAQLDGFYVGNNNTYNRPAYTYFNAFVSRKLGRDVSLVVSGTNIFNQDVQLYGYFGQQVYAPTNQFNPYSSAVAEAVGLGYGANVELLGLPPPTVAATLKLRL